MQCVSCESLSQTFIEFYENMKFFFSVIWSLHRLGQKGENHFPMGVDSLVVLSGSLKSKRTNSSLIMVEI